MIVEYQQADGGTTLHGYMMPDGPISAATGAMLRGWHSKCYWVAKKREAKGDAVTGRVVAGGPTGYDINEYVLNRDDLQALGITPEQARERSTVVLSARVALLREVAERLGKSIGDPQVQEAFLAAEHGGPYPHTHEHRLENYQLIAHVQYAHHYDGNAWMDGDIRLHHMEMHASERQARITAARPEQDTSSDWREQFTAELGER